MSHCRGVDIQLVCGRVPISSKFNFVIVFFIETLKISRPRSRKSKLNRFSTTIALLLSKYKLGLIRLIEMVIKTETKLIDLQP